MTPALESRIRDAIRNALAKAPNAIANNLDPALAFIAKGLKCTPAEARAVWDKHFAITEAN